MTPITITFSHAQVALADMSFPDSVSHIKWTPGTAMPATLIDRIVAKLASLAPTIAVKSKPPPPAAADAVCV